MKRETLFHSLYIGLFLALSLLPLLILLLFGPAEAAANERVHAAPRLTEADGSFNASVLNDTADYFADHFGLRQEYASVWAGLNAAGAHTSVEEQVILGSEGWLYFRDTEDDYRGLGLSDAELTAIAKNLARAQSALEARGIRFVFTVAPNKNSLYPEHMPSYIPRDPDTSNAARLPAFLAREGVACADLFEAFRARPETLYFRTDSHWNSRGAALAADTLLREAGRESGWSALSFSGTQPHTGDLCEMLYPRLTPREADPVCDRAFAHTCDADPNGGNAITIRTRCAGAEGTLYCWRDSFGISLYPYLADSFSSAVFSRSAVYDLTGEDVLSSDVVILEIVERNLSRLAGDDAFIFPED